MYRPENNYRIVFRPQFCEAVYYKDYMNMGHLVDNRKSKRIKSWKKKEKESKRYLYPYSIRISKYFHAKNKKA